MNRTTTLPVATGLALAASMFLFAAPSRAQWSDPPPPAPAVPQASSTAAPEPPRYSTGMMVGGIITSSLGGAALFGGFAVLGSAASCSPFCSNANPGAGVAGLALMSVGLTLACFGVPLIVVGASHPRPEDPVPSEARAVVRAGPGSVALHVAF